MEQLRILGGIDTSGQGKKREDACTTDSLDQEDVVQISLRFDLLMDRSGEGERRGMDEREEKEGEKKKKGGREGGHCKGMRLGRGRGGGAGGVAEGGVGGVVGGGESGEGGEGI